MIFQPVMISGLTASGKTTHTHLLSGELGWQSISATELILLASGKTDTFKADFWASEQAKEISKVREKDDALDRWVDSELLRRANSEQPIIIDTFGIPWMTQVNGLRIWLESNLESRVKKAIVSYKKGGIIKPKAKNDIQNLLIEKDNFIRNYFLREYHFDIASDYSIFDLVIDISEFITCETIEASYLSVRKSQNIISSAVSAYIWGTPMFLDGWKSCYQANRSSIHLPKESKLARLLL